MGTSHQDDFAILDGTVPAGALSAVTLIAVVAQTVRHIDDARLWDRELSAVEVAQLK